MFKKEKSFALIDWHQNLKLYVNQGSKLWLNTTCILVKVQDTVLEG